MPPPTLLKFYVLRDLSAFLLSLLIKIFPVLISYQYIPIINDLTQQQGILEKHPASTCLLQMVLQTSKDVLENSLWS